MASRAGVQGASRGRADPRGACPLAPAPREALKASNQWMGHTRIPSLLSSPIKSLPTQVWSDSGKRKMGWLMPNMPAL